MRNTKAFITILFSIVIFLWITSICSNEIRNLHATALDQQKLIDQSQEIKQAYLYRYDKRAERIWDQDHNRAIGLEIPPCDHVGYRNSLIALDGDSLSSEPLSIRILFEQHWGDYAPYRWVWERDCKTVKQVTPLPKPVKTKVGNVSKSKPKVATQIPTQIPKVICARFGDYQIDADGFLENGNEYLNIGKHVQCQRRPK